MARSTLAKRLVSFIDKLHMQSHNNAEIKTSIFPNDASIELTAIDQPETKYGKNDCDDIPLRVFDYATIHQRHNTTYTPVMNPALPHSSQVPIC
jgi:hypothetical protein